MYEQLPRLTCFALNPIGITYDSSHASPGLILHWIRSSLASFDLQLPILHPGVIQGEMMNALFGITSRNIKILNANVNAAQCFSKLLTRNAIGHPQYYKKREEHLAFEFCSKITTTLDYKTFEVGHRRFNVDFFCWQMKCDMSSPLSPQPINEANKDTLRR